MENCFKDARLLLVEDDLGFSNLVQKELSGKGMKVTPVYRGQEAVRKASQNNYELIILDLLLPDNENNLLEIFYILREMSPEVPIIIVSSAARISHAMEAVKKGAYDVIEKPVESMSILEIPIRNALESVFLRKEHKKYISRLAHQIGIVGNSPAIKKVLDDVAKCAPFDLPVLILGETGVGKELIAKAIHAASRRSEKVLLEKNIGGLDDELASSELFGHIKGAFTGAVNNRKGAFELANEGTLFLDEIGDLSLKTQVKLLRVLQDGIFYPLGSETPVETDVRIIAATNKDLTNEITSNRFREDLFYRLNGYLINLPPLRDRIEDVPLLVKVFLNEITKTYEFEEMDFSPEAIKCLMDQEWKGNINDLKWVVGRSVIINENGNMIDEKTVIEALNKKINKTDSGGIESLKEKMDEYERKIIVSVISKHNGNHTRAAEELGIDRKTLYRKKHEYGIL